VLGCALKHMSRSRAAWLSVLCCTLAPVDGFKKRGKGGGGKAAAEKVALPGFEGIDCKECMTKVMRQLVPASRGCPAGNGTVIPSSTPLRVAPAFCDTELPKRRKCIAYSFGIDSVWDFDKAMVSRGCRVLSFDPTCCGAAHRVSEFHDFIPVGLATYDGLADFEDPLKPNTTIPVLTMKTIMDSYEHPKVDVLRLKISANKEWKGLKNLINTGVIQDIGQLSLNIHLSDNEMWEEYKDILVGLKSAGFLPFYVARQPNAEYLKVQEGSLSLYNKYEASFGNLYRR